jgi:DNA-binding IclR family transcriptional regulator
MSDGAWHKFDDLSAQTKLDKNTIIEITNFLRDYGFIEISKTGEAAKLDDSYIKL